MPIDTLQAAKRLQEEGTFSPEQAERIASVLSEMDVASATKEDLDDLEERLTARIDRLGERVGSLETHVEEKVPTKAELEAMEERLEGKLTTRLFGAVGLLAGLLAVFEFLV